MNFILLSSKATEVSKKSPSFFDPRPNSIIQEYQSKYGKVQYNTKTGSSVVFLDRS